MQICHGYTFRLETSASIFITSYERASYSEPIPCPTYIAWRRGGPMPCSRSHICRALAAGKADLVPTNTALGRSTFGG